MSVRLWRRRERAPGGRLWLCDCDDVTCCWRDVCILSTLQHAAAPATRLQINPDNNAPGRTRFRRRCHDYSDRPGRAVPSRPPGRPVSRLSISRTGPFHSAVNGTSASHLSTWRGRGVAGGRGREWLAYRYLAFEPNTLTDAVQTNGLIRVQQLVTWDGIKPNKTPANFHDGYDSKVLK